MFGSNGLIIGVVSDTHVPDRVEALHPDLLPRLRLAGVTQILHAGDICSPQVLGSLNELAPVTAVRGNRDWMFAGKLPWRVDVTLGNLKLTLVHGMGSWGKYLEYKLLHSIKGYSLDFYLPILRKAGSGADVVVFGHTHHPEIVREGGKLYFNPGSAGVGQQRGFKPTFGLLNLLSDGQVEAQICELG